MRGGRNIVERGAKEGQDASAVTSPFILLTVNYRRNGRGSAAGSVAPKATNQPDEILVELLRLNRSRSNDVH